MTADRVRDLRARLDALAEIEAGPHGGISVFRQDIAAARRYIEDLIDAAGRGEEAFEQAIEEDRPKRLLGAYGHGSEHFLTVRSYLTVLPDEEHPEQVAIPHWEAVPPPLRDDVVSLASRYVDIITNRKIGRPKNSPVS